MNLVLDFLKTYWFVGVIGIAIVVMLVMTANRSDELDRLSSEIKAMSDMQAERSEAVDGMSTEFDSEAHVEKIETATVSAKDIGEKVIAVDDTITAFYKTAAPFPEDEDKRQKLFDELAEAERADMILRNTPENAHSDTWQLNPDWDLELESVVAYQATDSIPVVFTMTTTEGDDAGIVTAVFDVNDNSLTNIARHYTAAGLDDAASIGGR